MVKKESARLGIGTALLIIGAALLGALFEQGLTFELWPLVLLAGSAALIGVGIGFIKDGIK